MIIPDNKVTVKGVKASVAQKVFFDDYEFCLSSLSPKPVDIRRIGSDLHRMFTYSAENIGLSAWYFNVCIWTLENGILYAAARAISNHSIVLPGHGLLYLWKGI